MKKWQKIISYLFCTSLLFMATTLHSSEKDENPRTIVGERIATAEELAAMEAERQETALHNSEEEQSQKEDQELSELLARGMSAEHALAYHQAYAIDYDFGSQIELLNGSVWAVRANSRGKVRNWLPTDILFIGSNSSSYSNFKLENQSTGNSAEVDLILGPFYYGERTSWIISIDWYNRRVTLNDGSQWDISLWSKPELRRWMINDTVLIGVNKGISSWFNSSLLINVATKDFVRCNRSL